MPPTLHFKCQADSNNPYCIYFILLKTVKKLTQLSE